MKLVLATAVILFLTPIAAAQDYLGSFLQSDNFGRQLERSLGNSRVRRPNHPQHQQAAWSSQAKMKALMRRLRPEYERRVRRDGKASADRRHKRTAYRLGVEEGRHARR